MTYGCRIVTVFTWFFGSIFIGLLISALQKTSSFTRSENKAFKSIKNSLSAVKLLNIWVKFINVKRKKPSFRKLQRARDRLNDAAQIFKQSRIRLAQKRKKNTEDLEKDLEKIRSHIQKSSVTLDYLLKLYE